MLVLDIDQKFEIEFLIDPNDISKTIEIINSFGLTYSILNYRSYKRVMVSMCDLRLSSLVLKKIEETINIYSANNV